MLLKCFTQYVSKFGKLSSGQRTGKGQFSFKSHRRAKPKNIPTTVQLHSFNMLARLCSKSFKLGFSSMWTENSQMYKLGLENAVESEINCQHLLDHGEIKGIPETHLLLLHWLCWSLWLCGSQQTVENSYRDWNTRPWYLSPEKPVCWSRSNG